MQAYQDGKDWGFYTLVPPEDLKKTSGYHYISTFGVKQPEKPSQPCRLVFQANQKTDIGLSLNDHLHKGQDILSNLVTMVFRFRSFKYAFNPDIHRMFHRFALNPHDQDFLRFFAVIKKDGKITHES